MAGPDMRAARAGSGERCPGREKGLHSEVRSLGAACAAHGDSLVDLAQTQAEPNQDRFYGIELGAERDLFGDPIAPGSGRRGRPIHLPSAASRALVASMRADGAKQTEVCAALGISAPTLRLNYPRELGSSSTTWRRRRAPQNGRKLT